jgi:hypothetical protein
MNQKQVNALAVLLSRLKNERNMEPVESPAVIAWQGTRAVIDLKIPFFPHVSIGKQGGYDMPDIHSYPQENGMTALDACVFGDWHLNKQHSGRQKNRVLPYGGHRDPQPADNTVVTEETAK